MEGEFGGENWPASFDQDSNGGDSWGGSWDASTWDGGSVGECFEITGLPAAGGGEFSRELGP